MRRFAYVPNYTSYVASVGDVALMAEVVSGLLTPPDIACEHGGLVAMVFGVHNGL